jgi:hypothetical protein
MSSAAVVVAPGRETEAAHGRVSVCCGTASPDESGQGFVEIDVGALALTVEAVAPVPFATVRVVPVPGVTVNDPFVGVSVETDPYAATAVVGLPSAEVEIETSPYFDTAHGVGLAAAHSTPPCVAELWSDATCSPSTEAAAPWGTIETHVDVPGQLLPVVRLVATSIRPGMTPASAVCWNVHGPANGCTSSPPHPFGLYATVWSWMNFATPLIRPPVHVTTTVMTYGCVLASSFVTYADQLYVTG